MPLRQMRGKDSIAYGSKAANLGELIYKRVPGVIIPDGFGVPYAAYAKFMKDNGFDKIIDDLMDDNAFVHNPRVRRQKLDEFRKTLQNGKFDPALRHRHHRALENAARRQARLCPQLVKQRGPAQLLRCRPLLERRQRPRRRQDHRGRQNRLGLSLEFSGYEARVRNYVSQDDVYMSAFIQVGVDMDRGGVMITKDPFDDKTKTPSTSPPSAATTQRSPPTTASPSRCSLTPSRIRSSS